MKLAPALFLGVCLTPAAFAADWGAPAYAYRGAYPADAGRDWSGPYIGANLGYGWGGAKNDYWNPNLLVWEADGDINYNSVTGGLHAGFRQQFGAFVAGIEADANLSRYKGDDSMAAGRINEIAINAMGTLRGQFGISVDRFLVYGTAGLALAQFEKTDRHGGVPANAQWAGGWVAGGGVELALDSNWSVRAEYLHTRLGDTETGINVNDPPFVGTYTHRANAPTLNVLRVGASYSF